MYKIRFVEIVILDKIRSNMSSDSSRKYEILITGSFTKDKVITNFDKEDVPRLTKNESDNIDLVWADLLDKARITNQSLFDSQLINLRSIEQKNNLIINTRPTSYKNYIVGLNCNDETLKTKLEQVFPFSICAVIKTSDDKIICARRSNRTFMGKNMIHLIPAGHPQPNKTKVNLFSEILKEASEEIGILPEDVEIIFLLGILKTISPPKPEIVFYLRLNITSKEILQRFTKSVDGWEHEKIIIVDSHDIINFVTRNYLEIADVMHGAVEMYQLLNDDLF